jgi:hypothetical protein
MPAFDLQSVWTAAGMAAAAVVIGYVLGFVASAIPNIPTTETWRRAEILALDVLIVGGAALTSGATLSPESFIGAALVFIGLYNAAANAHDAGVNSAVRYASGSPAKP